jgi:hypothetical protein
MPAHLEEGHLFIASKLIETHVASQPSSALVVVGDLGNESSSAGVGKDEGSGLMAQVNHTLATMLGQEGGVNLNGGFAVRIKDEVPTAIFIHQDDELIEDGAEVYIAVKESHRDMAVQVGMIEHPIDEADVFWNGKPETHQFSQFTVSNALSQIGLVRPVGSATPQGRRLPTQPIFPPSPCVPSNSLPVESALICAWFIEEGV